MCWKRLRNIYVFGYQTRMCSYFSLDWHLEVTLEIIPNLQVLLLEQYSSQPEQTWNVRSFLVPGMVIPIESPWEACSIYACIWIECKFRGRCCPLLACLVIQLLLKIAVKDHATLIVADHHPLNVLDEWSGSFSIFGTFMTSTMRTRDGLNISRRRTDWSSWAFCFFYSMYHLLIKM